MMMALRSHETGRELRRDAAENRDRILCAARQAFDEEGFEVGIEVIARRAGVGVGTVYRRFPTKDLLIESIIEEVWQSFRDAAVAASADDGDGDGIFRYLFSVGELLTRHYGCLSRIWSVDSGAVLVEIEREVRSLVQRAQSAGTLRRDVVYEDVVTICWALQGIIERTANSDPRAWRRHLELVVHGLAPTSPPLTSGPMSPQQFERARRSTKGQA
jgi:AcrR family transcriptional regulator